MSSSTTARLEARLPADVMAVLKRAVEIEGRTLTDFVGSAAHAATLHTIAAAGLMRLPAEDFERFAAAVLDPPAPATALGRALGQAGPQIGGVSGAGLDGQFGIERLASGHDRSGFDSGSPTLDAYLRSGAGQDVRRQLAGCSVAVDAEGVVAGFYTLSATSVALTDLPGDFVRRLPRYPSVPAHLIGRLAVDPRAQGRKLGAALLADALRRSLRADAAAFATPVDAKDEGAAAFYRHHGFLALAGRPRRLFLPLATAAALAGGGTCGCRGVRRFQMARRCANLPAHTEGTCHARGVHL